MTTDSTHDADAVETVRQWVNSARFDEELIELEAQTLHAMLAAHDAAVGERDARIAELERELRELRGTKLNPSPLMLDAQAYGELRDEIAATMGDEWDLDEAEISILIKYVRWLAAGQPRDEDGYPIRRKAPEGLAGASGASRCRNLEATTPPQPEREPQHDEFGLRIDYVSTLREERALAETLGDALAELEEFDAQHYDNVVSRTLIQRKVGDWHEIGDGRG